MKITSIVAEGNATGRLLVSFDNGARIWTTEAHLRDRALFVDTVRAAGLPLLDEQQLRDWSSVVGQHARTFDDGFTDRMYRPRVGPGLDELSIR